MTQLRLQMDPDFERDLSDLMRLRGIGNRSEAIRFAVRESIGHSRRQAGRLDFERWRGAALAAPVSSRLRFGSDADLWKRG